MATIDAFPFDSQVESYESDGTPIYDIKPYLAYVDSHPEAAGGFTDQIQDHKLKVEFPEKLLKKIPLERCGSVIPATSRTSRKTVSQGECTPCAS